MSGSTIPLKFNEFPYDECPHCKTKSLMVEWEQRRVQYSGAGSLEMMPLQEISHCTNCDYTDQDFLKYRRDYCDWPRIETKLPEIEWKTNES